MKELTLLFLFLSEFTYIHGNSYCVDFSVFDSIKNKSIRESKCDFTQPGHRERKCHNINNMIKHTTSIRETTLSSSEIRALTDTEIVPDDVWEEKKYVRRPFRSHYVDVYELPDCKGSHTELNKLECYLTEILPFNLIPPVVHCDRSDGNVRSLIIYPRDLPREGLPLDDYKTKIMFDEGNNSTL
uniref:Uncharacterized protein n=1 Tax=Cacopsylla melanoneura TaxID=428564 RepID=A0A8D8LZQ6_9HEMI